MHPTQTHSAPPLVDLAAEHGIEDVICDNAPFILWAITQGGRREPRTLPELVQWFQAEFADELKPGTSPSSISRALAPFFVP